MKIVKRITNEIGPVSKVLVIGINITTDTHSDIKVNYSRLPCKTIEIDLELQELTTNYDDLAIVKKELLNDLREIINKHATVLSDVVVIGTQVSASLAYGLAQILGYNCIAISPHINLDQSNKNTRILKGMGFDICKMYSSSNRLKTYGKIFFSHYDQYNGSYDERVVDYFQTQNYTQLTIIDEYVYGATIKNSKLSLVGIAMEPLIKCIHALEAGVAFEHYDLVPLNEKSKRTQYYPGEKTYHKIIEGKNRHIKYREDVKFGSNVLVVTLPSEIGVHTHMNVNHDNMSRYVMPFLEQYDFNVLFLKSTFAETGGFMMYDYGKQYPPELIISIIEEKRKQLGVPKENVILTGMCAGGTAAMYYAKIGGYGHIYAISPVIDVETHLWKSPFKFFGINIKETEQVTSVIAKEKQEKFNFEQGESNLKGVIRYTDKDENLGMIVTEAFKKVHPYIQYHDISDMFEQETVPHRICILKSWIPFEEEHMMRDYILNNLSNIYKREGEQNEC